jgi:putative PIN family toxin of toxin-antitoxin system
MKTFRKKLIWLGMGIKTENPTEIGTKIYSFSNRQKIIEEFLDVSSRAKIKKYVKDEQSILNVFDLIKTYCVDDSVENIIVPALRDNDDLYLLALAKAVGANILLTGDLDLLTLKRYNQIEIISFSEFMTRLL